jgi:hypothetical protein
MPYVEISSPEVGKFIPISEEEAKRATKSPSRLAPAYETVKSIGTVWGPLEVGAELVSGIPAFVAGGITSGAEAISGKKIPYADKLVELLESPSIMYRPKTASGQQLESALANIFITARETGQEVADVVLDKTGSPVLSTIVGTTVGGIPEILMVIAGIKKGLRPKAKAPGFVTPEEWGELKPKPEQIEFKPRVEVPPELQAKALPPGQGFVLLDKKPETILRSKPPKGKEVLISETGEPITPESVIPQELKTKALPPSQGFVMLDEKPATILRQPPPPLGKPVEISPTGEPIYPEGVKPVLEKLPLTETEKMKAPVVTKEGKTIGIKPEASGLGILKSEKGAIQIPTVEDIKRVTNRFKEFWSPFSTLPQKENLLKIRGEALGSMARTERIVDRAINLTKGLPDQAKKDIFEAMDMSRKDINTLPPEQARIAKEFITVNNLTGKMLVERGLIGEEAYSNLKGQYIKYSYLKHILGEDVEIPINPNGKINTNALKARKGLTLEQQKAIGFIEDVSIAQPLGMAQSLSNIVKYDYLEKLASDPRNVWTPSIVNISDMPRKYSESIAKAQATRLSRSTGDPHRAVQVGNDWQVMNIENREMVGKKMGIGELYEEVELYKKMVKANPNSPEIAERLGVYEKYLKDVEQATKNVPKDFIQMPTAKSWGPLAGTFLRKEVARDLMSFYGKERGNIQGLTKTIDTLVDLDQKATGLFKIGKVPLNLPTVVRNTISNQIQLNMSGMNFADIIKNMVRTGEDFIKKPPTFTKASRAGLFKTNFSVTEINEVMDQFRHLKGDTFADVLGAVKNLSKYYGKIDDFFKYTKLLDGLGKGLSFDKSMIEAQKWVMDYSLADPSVKWARKHFVPFACVDETTEILTKRGWLNHRQLMENDEVLSFDIENEKLIWKPVSGKVEYKVKTELIHFKTRSIDMLLTPNHRVVASHLNKGLTILEAQNINTQYSILVAAYYDNFPLKGIYSDDFVRLAGWFLTEGHFHPKCRALKISQNEGFKSDQIRSVLKSVCPDFSELSVNRKGRIEVQFYIPARIGKLFKNLFPNKSLTFDFVLSLPKPQLELLKETMISGDGCISNGREFFIQKNNDTLNAYQFMCVLLGISNGRCKSDYRTTSEILTRTKKKYSLKRCKPKKVSYDGIVWCPEIPDTGTWVARRNGSIFITGNSYQYKIAPLVAESAIKRPWVIAKYMAIPPAIMALTKELYKDEMTEDDWKGLESSIPREVQRRQSFMIVPWKIKDKWYWFDYSYFLPWGNYMNAISSVSSGDIKAPLTQFGIGGTPALTALKTFSGAAIRNEPPKDSFSGNPLYNRLDEPIDKALKVSEYFYNLFAPSMVTRYGALGETLDIGKEDRYGRKVEAEQAIGKWAGINLKEANPKLAAIIKKAKINALKDEYMKIMIDPKISTEKKERYAQRFQEEIAQIMGGKD